MTPEQAMEAGRAFALAHLDVTEAAYGEAIAAAYAAGHAWAARDFVAKKCGARAAYELHQDLADKAALAILPEGA